MGTAGQVAVVSDPLIGAAAGAAKLGSVLNTTVRLATFPPSAADLVGVKAVVIPATGGVVNICKCFGVR